MNEMDSPGERRRSAMRRAVESAMQDGYQDGAKPMPAGPFAAVIALRREFDLSLAEAHAFVTRGTTAIPRVSM